MTAVAVEKQKETSISKNLGRRRALGILGIVVALGALIVLSIAVGANPLSFSSVWQGFTAHDSSEASIIVWSMRIPRTLVGIVTGAAFGVAGALIQALTRNPLADPGILGVNAGAGFAVTVGVGFFGLSSVTGYIWFAFLGAAAATLLVYFIGASTSGSVNPVALVLAGVALAAVLGGVTSFLTLIDPETFESIRNWNLGSVARTDLSDTMTVLPFLAVGLAIALPLLGALHSGALGDDLAASLGTKVMRTRHHFSHLVGRRRDRPYWWYRLRRPYGSPRCALGSWPRSTMDHHFQCPVRPCSCARRRHFGTHHRPPWRN